MNPAHKLTILGFWSLGIIVCWLFLWLAWLAEESEQGRPVYLRTWILLGICLSIVALLGVILALYGP